MHTHPSPSAHVCTTLPPGDVPMRDTYPDQPFGTMHLVSQCGAVKRVMRPQGVAKYPFVPIGTWDLHETRKASDGQWWGNVRADSYYVVDNFGDLISVAGRESGAA